MGRDLPRIIGFQNRRKGWEKWLIGCHEIIRIEVAEQTITETNEEGAHYHRHHQDHRTRAGALQQGCNDYPRETLTFAIDLLSDQRGGETERRLSVLDIFESETVRSMKTRRGAFSTALLGFKFM